MPRPRMLFSCVCCPPEVLRSLRVRHRSRACSDRGNVWNGTGSGKAAGNDAIHNPLQLGDVGHSLGPRRVIAVRVLQNLRLGLKTWQGTEAYPVTPTMVGRIYETLGR